MPPKFKRHLNDDEVTGSVKSERVSASAAGLRGARCPRYGGLGRVSRNLLEEDSDEEEDFFLRGPSGARFGPRNDKIRQ
ncbi:hypothetical protein EK904_013687 [Melospiza melodia maxima]|nr:hypothetical protein EK904_013687 [Melospiza melodia maxima]